MNIPEKFCVCFLCDKCKKYAYFDWTDLQKIPDEWSELSHFKDSLLHFCPECTKNLKLSLGLSVKGTEFIFSGDGELTRIQN